MDVLLAVGVGLEAACVVGVVIMPTTFDRLHFVGAAATVPAFCILAAVLCREHLSSGGIEAVVAVAVTFFLFPVLLTATARAIHRVENGEP